MESDNENMDSTEISSSNNINNDENSSNSNNSFDVAIEPESAFPKINTDYLFNVEYFDEMYTNFLLDEKYSKFKINSNYMNNQNDINYYMRAILIDWIIEVHHKLFLKRKTLFLTIYIIDLYLSKNTIDKKKFQLLGIACLLSASKIIDLKVLTVERLVQSTDNSYNKEELRQKEIEVMKCLNFEVFLPTSEEFYNIISKQFKFEGKQHLFGEYILDCSLLDYHLLRYKPSVIGAACAYIVMKYYHINEYTKLYKSPFTLENSQQIIVKNCAKELCFIAKNLSDSNTFKSVRKKYSFTKYGNVADLFK